MDPNIDAGSSTALPNWTQGLPQGTYLQITCLYVYESTTTPDQGGTELVKSSKQSSPIKIYIKNTASSSKGFRTSGDFETTPGDAAEITWFMMFGENGVTPPGSGSGQGSPYPGGNGGSSNYAYVTMPRDYALANYPGSFAGSVEADVSLSADVFNDSTYPATTGTISGGAGSGGFGNGGTGSQYTSTIVNYFASKFPGYDVEIGSSGTGGSSGQDQYGGRGGGGGAGGLIVEIKSDPGDSNPELDNRPPDQTSGSGGTGRDGRPGSGGGSVKNNPSDSRRQIGGGGGGGGSAAEKDGNTSGQGSGGQGQGAYLFVGQIFT